MTVKHQKPKLLRPKDAATLIIVRATRDGPAVLMGRRNAGHAFMPNKYVFPGGRVDLADTKVAPASDLDAATMGKLLVDMKGRPSVNRARGLAMAAVRETFEEAGMIIGKPVSGEKPTRSPSWQQFHATGFAPDLSVLRFFARAITPPMRTRRFDTRFFVVDYGVVTELDEAEKPQSEELLDCDWVPLRNAGDLDLPGITKDILQRLSVSLDGKARLKREYPVSFQRFLHRRWLCDTL